MLNLLQVFFENFYFKGVVEGFFDSWSAFPLSLQVTSLMGSFEHLTDGILRTEILNLSWKQLSMKASLI